MLSRNRKAYSTLFWIGFLTFCIVPMLALALNLGRYFYARAEMYKCADAAALAAAQEVDVPHFLLTGEAMLLPSAFELAGGYGGTNSDYLAHYKIYPRISNISVDMGRRLVVVDMAATTAELVPLIGPITLYGHGEAEARLSTVP
jgi:hypothetical protein